MKNILKRMFLSLTLVSLSIMIAIIPVTMSVYYSDFILWPSYMHKDEKIITRDFYKSDKFEYNVIENIFNLISYTVVDVDSEVKDYIEQNTTIEEVEYKDENGNVQTDEYGDIKTKEVKNIPTKEDAIKSINENVKGTKEDINNNYSGVKFIAINKDSNIVYSNTPYKTVEEYKNNVDGYVDIELVKKSHTNGYYKKDINGKVYTNNRMENINPLNMVNNKSIEVYMSFPKNINNGSLLQTYMDEYKQSINYIQIYLTIGSISVVVFLLALILYKLTKGQAINKDGIFIKIVKKVPLEGWIVSILIIGIFTINFLTSHYYGYSYWVEKICGFIGSFIIITMLYIQLYIFKGYDKKLDFFKSALTYKVFKALKNNTTKVLETSKKIPLTKQIILVAILLSGGSLFIGLCMVMLEFGYIGAGMPIFIAMTAFTWYIVKKLSYLSEIIDGTQKIKDGDLNYKIEIEGHDSFAQLAQNINNIGDGLENSIDKQLRSERLRSELITNVSHDLKTPLTSIINYIELIKKEDNIQPEHLNDYVNVLDSKSKRLKSLIEDLFEASKASSGNLELNMENLDITQLLRQSIGELEEKLNNSNLDLKINVPTEKVYIYADGRRMYRVFENLLSNIAKYSLPNTRVYIDVIEETENIKLTMKNISAYELNFDSSEITERFKRGDESRNTEGSGLGLAIAKDLVKLQNGKFDIDIDGDLFKATIEFKRSNK